MLAGQYWQDWLNGIVLTGGRRTREKGGLRPLFPACQQYYIGQDGRMAGTRFSSRFSHNLLCSPFCRTLIFLRLCYESETAYFIFFPI